jgi:DNA invertase Pin-like site-specific DNA recombinase
MENNNLTALYCRSAQKSAMGIEKQECMLRQYAEKHGYGNIAVYVDNGCSGLSLDRPAFTRLQADIAAGLVKTVIVKDIGRISRDAFMLCDWMKNGLCNTHLISVMNGYDSEVEICLVG